MVMPFRKHTLFSLNNCLYALQPTTSHLSRSALHRCFFKARLEPVAIQFTVRLHVSMVGSMTLRRLIIAFRPLFIPTLT